MYLLKYLTQKVCISDVESQEDARLCNFWEDVCYGKLTIAEVNVTLSQGSTIDLIEIKIQKGKCYKYSLNACKSISGMRNHIPTVFLVKSQSADLDLNTQSFNKLCIILFLLIRLWQFKFKFQFQLSIHQKVVKNGTRFEEKNCA